MGKNNFLCMICCLSFKKKSSSSNKSDRDEEGRDLNMIQTVTQFSEQILSPWTPQPVKKQKDELPQQGNSGDNNGVKRTFKKKKRGKKKVFLEDLIEKEMQDSEVTDPVGLKIEQVNMGPKITVVLDSCEPDNISICPDCVASMKIATVARNKTIEFERRVRELQLLLLKGLRCLNRQMEAFYEEMKKIEACVSMSDASCLEAALKGSKKSKHLKTMFGKTSINKYTIRRERVRQFRRQCTEVSQDVQRFRSKISEKIFYETNQRGNKMDSIDLNGRTDFNQDVKMEIEEDPSLDTGETEDGFDFSVNMGGGQSSSVFDADWFESDDEQIPETESTSTAENTRTSSENGATVQVIEDELDMEESSESETNEDDSDDDYNPIKTAKKRFARSVVDADRTPCTRDVEFLLKDMSEFKRRVVEGVLKKRRSNHCKLNKELKQERTPFHKHMLELEFHPDRKVIILSGIEINILDKEITQEVENGLECSKCSFKVFSMEEKMEQIMYDHIISKHFEAYACPICEIKLDTDLDYRTHLKDCRRDADVFQCEACGKKLGSKRSLEIHRWVVHMNEEEKAEALANGFKPPKPKVMNRNVERSFQCQTCGKGFKSSTSLRFHQETHKSREEREQQICPICGKSFIKSGFEYHEKYSKCALALRGESLPPVQCQICQKVIKNKNILQRHIKLQHSDLKDSRPFACSHCGKAFKYKSSLQKHEFAHLGLKPYKCNCGSSFSDEFNCKRHQKTCRNVSGGGCRNPEYEVGQGHSNQNQIEAGSASSSYQVFKNVHYM